MNAIDSQAAGERHHVSVSANEVAEAPHENRESTFLGLTAETWLRILAPLLVGVVSLGAWQWIVKAQGIPSYILPGPIEIVQSLVANWDTLQVSLWITLQITFAALFVAAALGLALAVLFALSRIIEVSLFPYAVILQVTPVVAIAPLIIIWVDDIRIALLICAWIVAFFPILSNTTLGLNSADHNLQDLFRLYRASRWQVLMRLRLPTAMPYFLGGLRISGGLALIGAIVAEFVAGTGGRASGLAYRILEAGYQLQIPKMFAALLLISATGIAIFLAMTLISHLALRHWHESAMKERK
jgi:NitT/TauT family transport system permease protein